MLGHRMRHRPRHHSLLLSVLVISVTLSSVATAQQVDPALQGRLLQQSDGSLYVYSDGVRHPIQPTALSDDDIGTIPLGAPIDRLDQIVAQPPTAGGQAFPQPGTTLYQADWSAGASGWALPGDWQVTGGLLTDTGASTDMSVITAPYEPSSPDYAVEAEMQATKYATLPPFTPAGAPVGFGFVSRAGAGLEYHAGVFDAGHNAGILIAGGPMNAALNAVRPFIPGDGWHVYRLEAKGEVLRLLVDGVVWIEGSPSPGVNGACMNCVPAGRLTGIWARSTQVNIRNFKVFAL